MDILLQDRNYIYFFNHGTDDQTAIGRNDIDNLIKALQYIQENNL